jgi:hypothetical protein
MGKEVMTAAHTAALVLTKWESWNVGGRMLVFWHGFKDSSYLSSCVSCFILGTL